MQDLNQFARCSNACFDKFEEEFVMPQLGYQQKVIMKMDGVWLMIMKFFE